MAWFILDTFIGGVSQTRLKTNRPLDQETRAAYRGLHPLSRQRVVENHAPELAKHKKNHPNPDEFSARIIEVFLVVQSLGPQRKTVRDGMSRTVSSSIGGCP
jgi:hypothetical protein